MSEPTLTDIVSLRCRTLATASTAYFIISGMYTAKGWLTWQLPVVAMLVVLVAYCTGCIWLAIPGLAYEAYKYTHQTNGPSSADLGAHSSNSRSVSQDTGSYDDSVE
jgi:hypothetical protein